MGFFFNSVLGYLLSIVVFYGVVGFVLLKTNPRTAQDEGVNVTVRLQRLYRERFKEILCAIVILWLAGTLYWQFRIEQLDETMLSLSTKENHKLQSEKETVEAQNEKLKAENATLKARLTQAEAHTPKDKE